MPALACVVETIQDVCGAQGYSLKRDGLENGVRVRAGFLHALQGQVLLGLRHRRVLVHQVRHGHGSGAAPRGHDLFTRAAAAQLHGQRVLPQTSS